MKFQYQVYHDFDAAKNSIHGLFFAIDEEKAQHEYSHFPMTLSHRFDYPEMIAVSEPASDSRGVIVTVETDLGQEEVDRALERALIDQNENIRGLCLVAKRLN